LFSWLVRYARWLHTGWPAGIVEKLPLAAEDGATSVPGLYIAGDLTGIPLLKFSSDTGARAVRTILADPSFTGRERRDGKDDPLDLVILGAGVAGMAAALEAQNHGLRFEIVEAVEPFATIVNFPRRKPIYTYPSGMTPAGDLQFTSRSDIKEGLLEELQATAAARGIQPRLARAERVSRRGRLLEVALPGQPNLLAHRVIVAIGRSGNFRRLGVPGEQLDKVANRLHDPKDYRAQDVLVVGGGDSALETAIAIAESGGRVVLSYRQPELSRPKPENVERLESTRTGDGAGGSVELLLASQVREIRERDVVVRTADGSDRVLPNDAVFTMIGREAPLDFFRRSGVRIRGERRPGTWAGFAAFLAFCVLLYNWKAGGRLYNHFKDAHWFPFNLPDALATPGASFSDPAHLLGTLRLSMGSPGFYYSLVYTLCIVTFGIVRIRRRRTPYITVQTATLMAFQVIPLFLLPYLLLPWAGHNGWFDGGAGGWLADHLFPVTEWDPQGREYWRAFGFILAWPLFIWNAFSWQPMWLWLLIGFVQTFVLIPILVYYWGKGAYCGWICSCGALAETLGDAHRQKMPHGKVWNRVNLLGQVVLAAAFVLLAARIVSWAWPGTWVGAFYDGLLSNWKVGTEAWHVQLNYFWLVDVTLAGIVGVGFYFWFSGRVWCRFACPLAALMHVYARFSRFRILAEKKKCISCNVCTSVCHQGIDVMAFANKGMPMSDVECVRCSACVQSCPTGTLTFGQVAPRTNAVLRRDRLAASPVLMAEAAPFATANARLDARERSGP